MASLKSLHTTEGFGELRPMTHNSAAVLEASLRIDLPDGQTHPREENKERLCFTASYST